MKTIKDIKIGAWYEVLISPVTMETRYGVVERFIVPPNSTSYDHTPFTMVKVRFLHRFHTSDDVFPSQIMEEIADPRYGRKIVKLLNKVFRRKREATT